MSVVWDRDAARDVLINAYGGDPDYPVEDGGVLDALEGCVRPAPADRSVAPWHRYLIDRSIPMHDDLEQCSVCPARPGEQHSVVRPAPAQIIEGRDWVGNPDGTLVYWQHEAEDARAKAAAVEEKFRRWVSDAAAAPAPSIDRDALYQLLDEVLVEADGTLTTTDAERYIERFVSLLRPASVEAIDREALGRLLARTKRHSDWNPERLGEKILALLRPADGVTLTREDTAVVLLWASGQRGSWEDEEAVLRKLEAAS